MAAHEADANDRDFRFAHCLTRSSTLLAPYRVVRRDIVCCAVASLSRSKPSTRCTVVPGLREAPFLRRERPCWSTDTSGSRRWRGGQPTTSSAPRLQIERVLTSCVSPTNDGTRDALAPHELWSQARTMRARHFGRSARPTRDQTRATGGAFVYPEDALQGARYRPL